MRLFSLLFIPIFTISFNAQANPLEKGKTLFNTTATPIACAVCHTLEDAGATGTIGPNLNELKPDEDRIRKAMQDGMGAMPSFADMHEADREAIVTYVVQVTQ